MDEKDGPIMDIEMEKKTPIKGPLSPSRDPNVFHLSEPREAPSAKLLKQMKSERKAHNRRLMIDRIVLENFKSYNGIREIGPFHKSFTSIVGPNGSGKSNLIESLLFIFGKRAKWMRLNKLNELIHNSSKHQDCHKASVEVHFHEIIDKDDPEDYDLVPNSEFSVRRTVFNQGNSKYEINRKEVSQNEVVTLLKSKGIDLDNNRFLILQGEVEQISLMKPKTNDPNEPGLLEYLEDIIGSNQHKEQIDQLELELDKNIDAKREKIERVKISEADLVKLDDTKNVAVEFVKCEKQGYQLLNIQYQLERYKHNEEVTKCENEVAELDAKLKEEKKKHKEEVKKNEGFLRNFNDLKKDIEFNEKTKADCQKRYEELNIRDAKVQNDKKHNLANEVKCKQQLEELEKQYQQIIENTAEIEKVLPDKEKKLKELTKEKEKEEDKLNDLLFKLRGVTEKLRKKKEDIEKDLNPHSIRYNKIKNEIDELNNEYSLSVKRKQNAEAEAEELAGKLEELTNTLKELQTYSNQIDEALERIEDISKENRGKIKELKDDEEALLNQLHEVNSKLEENKQSSSESRIQNQIVTELMKAQKRKELTGICGRLGDLGVIDEHYDVAISTACPQLDNIVVNRYDDAQKCVEFLRTNRIGKATFIALDKIDWVKDQMNKDFRVPKNAERLFDLVNAKNDKFRLAFYYALRDTLVCKDLDVATNIAYGQTRYRVVTLKGELIDLSGTMSGGGKPKRGGMGHKIKEEISEEQINQLVKQSQQITEKIDDIRREKQEVEKKLQEVTRDEVQAKKEKQRINMDIDFNAQQLQESTKKLEEIEKILKNKGGDEKKQKELEKQIRDSEKELEKVNEIIQKYKNQIQELDEKIAEIGGKELKDQQKKVHDLIEKHDELDKEVSKMQAQVQNVIKNLNKNKKEQLDVKEKLDKAKKALDKLREEERHLEEEGMKVLAVMKGCEEKKAELEKEFNKFDKENEKIKKLMTDLKAAIDVISAEKEEKNKLFKKAREEYNNAQKNLEANRKRYKDIIANYDFLDIIDEIQTFNVNELQNQKKGSKEDEEEGGMDEEVETEQTQEKHTRGSQKTKKLKMNFDPEAVYAVEVTQDLSMSQLEKMNQYYQDIKLRHATLTEKIKGMQPNINSIQEYKEKYLEHKNRLADLNQVKEQTTKIKNKIDDLKKKRFNEFMRGFNVISSKLKDTYQILTNGGDAELELIDSLDPFSEGVIFSVRPPKKSWKQMSKLSGGEKTLSSLALVFALHYFKPTPLYFMDEIDAALDYKNVAIVGNYIKEKTKNAQFIIISLRNNMFELADKLVGVYKTHDATKTITINPSKIEALIRSDIDEEDT